MRIPPEVARQREIDAWDLVQQGYTQRQIAERLKVTHQAVDQMLARIEKRLLTKLERRAKYEKSRQSSILDWVLTEAAEAWRLSKDAFKVSTKKTRKTPQRQSSSGAIIRNPDEPADAGLQLEELMNRAESRYGDARFLDQIRGALADKRKLWGLDVAPAAQAAISNPLDKLSPEDLERFADRLDKQIADARTSRGSK